MWQRIRRKYLVGLLLLSIAYPISFAPSLYYLMHYADPTMESIVSFQKIYRLPIKAFPQGFTTALLHIGGFPRPQAVNFAQRLHGFQFRPY